MSADKDLGLAQEMYRENILEHFKHPQNFGVMKNPTLEHKELNVLCGDNITVMLKIEGEKISDIKFTGNGCAISQASMSMLTDEIMGKKISDIKKITKDDIFKMLSIPISAARVKCALLSLDTVKNALKIHENYNDKNK